MHHHRPRVLCTSPQQYAPRLCSRLIEAGMRPIWLPGVHTRPLSDTRKLDAAVAPLLSPPSSPSRYDYVAFTSRAGVEAVMASISRQLGVITSPAPDAAARAAGDALRRSGCRVCALGADAELLSASYGVAADVHPVEDASTMGLVRTLEREWLEAAGEEGARNKGARRRPRVLCPVPRVGHGLVEPPVVPRFLAELDRAGGQAVRADAYWTVPGLIDVADGGPEGQKRQQQQRLQRRAAGRAAAAERAALAAGDVDAVVFSSTAEAQGLALQFMWAQKEQQQQQEAEEDDEDDADEDDDGGSALPAAAAALRELLKAASARRAALGLPPVLLAAHGPTTAAGVCEVLGLPLSAVLVSKDWSSFAGVTAALAGALIGATATTRTRQGDCC